MPVTIVPTSLRYKDGNQFVSADCLKGETGDTPVITAEKVGKQTSVMVNGTVIATILDGNDGSPGHSPVITASKSGKTTTISVDGTPIATILDGKDGADGFSPVVSLTKSGKVTTFSVTDAEDTYSVEINDGEDGNPGQDATPDLITVDYSDLTFPVVAGTMCYHSGLLYKANQAIAKREEWTAAHWTQTTIEAEQSTLEAEIMKGTDAISEENKFFRYDDGRSLTVFYPEIEQGMYNTSTGKKMDTNDYVRTKSLIPVDDKTPLVIYVDNSNIRYYVHTFNAKGELIANLGRYTNNKSIAVSSLSGVAYFALSLQKVNTSSAVPSDVDGMYCTVSNTFLDTLRSASHDVYSMVQALESVLNNGTIKWYPKWEIGRYGSSSASYSREADYIKTINPMPVFGGAGLVTKSLGTVTLLTELDINKNFVRQTTITSAPTVTLHNNTAFVGVSAKQTGIVPADGNGYFLELTSNLVTKSGLSDVLADYPTEAELEEELTNYPSKAELNMVVPSYFESQLATKELSIIQNMNACGSDGETFIFITDSHWGTNYKNSPALMNHVLNHTKVNHIIHGGDLIDQGEKADMYHLEIEQIRAFQFGLCDNFLPIARGNHDDNSNWVDQEDIDSHAFDYDTVFSLLYKDISDKVTFITTTEFSFYYDKPASKTRFIFVDTKRDGKYIPYSQLITLMNSTPADYKLVFIAHYIYKSTDSDFRQGGKGLLNMISAFNAKTSGSYLGVNYDFTNSLGKAVCVIAGHTHADYSWAKDAQGNPSSVPVIITDTDSYNNHSGTEGTTDSQCFDVVTIDYKNNTIKCVRVGRGNDRTFSFD